MLITKLSGLLRRLMRSTDHFVTLREELESVDEYLDIEVVRFGPQLRVVKEISAETLDVIVPSMLLQPLVENSIKHGLARKVGGGRITIRTSICDGHTIIEVHDDGLGMTEERLEHALEDGIGLSNVNERLRTMIARRSLEFRLQPARLGFVHTIATIESSKMPRRMQPRLPFVRAERVTNVRRRVASDSIAMRREFHLSSTACAVRSQSRLRSAIAPSAEIRATRAPRCALRSGADSLPASQLGMG
jgi:hypothetical protein